MKISTKSRYGTRAVLEIALNRNERNLTRKQISKNQEIPSSYLENILISLKTNGIIRTIRGPKGGYELAKKPEDIIEPDHKFFNIRNLAGNKIYNVTSSDLHGQRRNIIFCYLTVSE